MFQTALSFGAIATVTESLVESPLSRTIETKVTGKRSLQIHIYVMRLLAKSQNQESIGVLIVFPERMTLFSNVEDFFVFESTSWVTSYIEQLHDVNSSQSVGPNKDAWLVTLCKSTAVSHGHS